MRILVVDDAPYVLKALQDLLGAYGHEIYGAVNGEEALARYQELNPDVVLMDILMPKLDGVSATKTIIRYDAKAKIIVITAVGKPGLEKECIKAGAKSFIMKPFKSSDLLRVINSVN
jgi:two-component system chemotaxis response regulator CheY